MVGLWGKGISNSVNHSKCTLWCAVAMARSLAMTACSFIHFFRRPPQGGKKNGIQGKRSGARPRACSPTRSQTRSRNRASGKKTAKGANLASSAKSGPNPRRLGPVQSLDSTPHRVSIASSTCHRKGGQKRRRGSGVALSVNFFSLMSGR